jgi:hypothetical protein
MPTISTTILPHIPAEFSVYAAMQDTKVASSQSQATTSTTVRQAPQLLPAAPSIFSLR